MNTGNKYRTSRSGLRCAAVTLETDGSAVEELSSVSEEAAGLNIKVLKSDAFYTIVIEADPSRTDFRMHWAINDWSLAPAEFWPQNTVQVDDLAVQTGLDNSGKIVINFAVDSCPSKIVFVVKEGDKWLHNGSGDFVVYLKPPGVDDIVSKVIDAETKYERWSLFDRVNMATSLLGAAITAGPEGMGFMLSWLRLSSMRQLPWYKGSNYQSKDAAHAQKVLAQKMSDTICTAADPLCRLFARICLSTLPRGGGNGDDIRMGILHIMRQHGIREGHRPGIEDRFLESWHQKLHTNTTPEDITICEAYLAFLKSGDMGEFWRVAWENGRLTPESLQQMDHPVIASPFHLPQLIDSMEHYLWILKQTHSGADLDVAFEMVKGYLDGDLCWTIGDILANRNEWWVPGKIVEARHRLAGYWKNTNGTRRDVLLLDIALDSYFRVLIERIDKNSLGADDLFNLISLVLDNASISSENEYIETSKHVWNKVMNEMERWSGSEWAKMAMAAADVASVSLEDFADSIAKYVQPSAEIFASHCDIESSYILNFSEEVVRGQSATVLGQLLQLAGQHLRDAAGVGPWDIASVGSSDVLIGSLQIMPNLDSIQGAVIDTPTVIIADKLTGNEDIPENVVCIITGMPTDVLSHVAIRARAQTVLLASCFDSETLERFKEFGNEASVKVDIDGAGCISMNLAHKDDYVSGSSATKTPIQKSSNFKNLKIKSNASWVLEEKEFENLKVGGKALHLSELHSMLSSTPDLKNEVAIPVSLALPYGTLDKVLQDESNKKTKNAISELESSLAGKESRPGIPKELASLRGVLSDAIAAPVNLFEELSSKARSANLITDKEWRSIDCPSWKATWSAICQVWASSWNDRAWLSRKSMGIPQTSFHMSVLLQQIVPARYAFVLHTADPLTGESGNIHGELVIGLGEALVGNFPGRALSFTFDTATSTPHVHTFPSKVAGIFPASSEHQSLLIARSDSNAEDLEDFAGAGLYSSIPAQSYATHPIQYAQEEILWNSTHRQSILKQIGIIGMQIEAICNSPQDIEGVVDAQGNITIVQTRPQVLASNASD